MVSGVVSRGASLEGVTHMQLCLSTMPGLSAKANRVSWRLHTERGSLHTRNEQSEPGAKSQSLAISAGREAGLSLKLGGHRDST